MPKERSVFDREFKLRPVRLSHERTGPAELSTELCIRVKLLYWWRTDIRYVQDTLWHAHIKACPEQGRRTTEVYTHVARNRKPASPLDDLQRVGKPSFIHPIYENKRRFGCLFHEMG